MSGSRYPVIGICRVTNAWTSFTIAAVRISAGGFVQNASTSCSCGGHRLDRSQGHFKTTIEARGLEARLALVRMRPKERARPPRQVRI